MRAAQKGICRAELSIFGMASNGASPISAFMYMAALARKKASAPMKTAVR